MKAQLAVSAPEFDDQLEIIAKTFLEQAHAEKQRDTPNARLVYDLLDKAARVLRDPYKRARPTAVKVSGDEDAPLFNLSASAAASWYSCVAQY